MRKQSRDGAPAAIIRGSTVKRVFFWLSGAGTETLEKCPAWEQRKYVAFGATVLVPCLFAFIACSYALSTITDKMWVVFPVSLVWSFIILSIDRALLASYRPYASLIRKFGQFSLRFVVALLMGVTIAHPLVLLLFRDTITNEVEKQRTEEIEGARAAFAVQRDKAQERINSIEAGIAEQQKRWEETFKASFIQQSEGDPGEKIPGLTEDQQRELDLAIKAAAAPFETRLVEINAQLGELVPLLSNVNKELGFWQEEFEKEINGQRSGIIGEGPRARSIRSDQLEPRREESKRLGTLIEHLTGEKSGLEAERHKAETGVVSSFENRLRENEADDLEESRRIAALRQKIENDQADTFVTQQTALRESIKQQIDTRLKELAAIQAVLDRVLGEEKTRLADLQGESRRDILTQTLALHGLFFSEEGEAGDFALSTYSVLVLLFMLVDTIPLVVKFFTKAGPYDSLLDRDEVAFAVEREEFLKDPQRYAHQVLDGIPSEVEKTQAAKNLLGSLVVLAEEESREGSGRDFQEILQRKLNTFFEQQKKNKPE